jgi:hypothetical protein
MDEFGDFEGPACAPQTYAGAGATEEDGYTHATTTATTTTTTATTATTTIGSTGDIRSFTPVDSLLLSDEIIRLTETQLSRSSQVIFEGMVAIRCKWVGVSSGTTNVIANDSSGVSRMYCSLFPFGLVVRESSECESKIYGDVDFSKYCLHRNSRLQAVKLSTASSSLTPLGDFVVSVDSLSNTASTSITVLQFGCESCSDADAWVAQLNVVFKSILI